MRGAYIIDSQGYPMSSYTEIEGMDILDIAEAKYFKCHGIS